EELTPYLNYCTDLIENDLFKCCQLEQAIGVFENNELKAFLSTDSGRCYDTRSHFKAVEEILENGKSDLLQIITFYGVVEKDKIRLIYSPLSNNIDVSAKSNLVFLLNMNKFKMEFENLKQKAEEALDDINIQLKRLVGKNRLNLPIDQVFAME
ncbi:MAG: hypothetical protein WBP45_04455, partial [Daejeonella sp.]